MAASKVFVSCLLQLSLVYRQCTVIAEEPTNCTDNTTLKSGEIVSKCCVIPFLYLGELRYGCIKSSENSWCSATANYDIDQKKIECFATQDGGEGGSGEEKCHHFPSGLSVLTGGPRDVTTQWKVQCRSSHAVTSLWDDVHRFMTLGDVKCCEAPVDQNISHVFNLSMRVGGSWDPTSRWKAQCLDNYIITGFYAHLHNKKKLRSFGSLDAVKCSLVLGHRVDYSSCSTIDLPDNTGGRREPGTKWKTECPSGHFLSAVYNDKSFIGVKKIKCCPLKAVTVSQKPCTFEEGICPFWSFQNNDERSWQLRNASILENGDHTTGKLSGHILFMTNDSTTPGYSRSAQITSIGLRSSKQERCLSMWLTLRKFSRVSIVALRYDNDIGLPVHDSLGDVEGTGSTPWFEKQIDLPINTNYQLVIEGSTTTHTPGLIAIDDIQIKPKRFCTGLCSLRGPLQGSGNIHDGPVVLWQASCLQRNQVVTSAVTGLWDRQGSHFSVIEYLKCCNIPVRESYKMSLIGREGGPVSVDVAWNAQCKNNNVLTVIYSLNNFNGLYQLQCAALSQSRIDYSKCEVIWSEVRNHVGETLRLHVECPPNRVIVALYDHPGDNNKTSFADVDAIKCCRVITPNCVTSADCHSNANCVSKNDINRCVCQDGFHGNGIFCQRGIPSLFTSTVAASTTADYNVTTLRTEYQSTAQTTSSINGSDVPTQGRTDGGAVSTPGYSFVEQKQRKHHRSIIVILSVITALLVIVLILGVVVWRVRKAGKARRRITENQSSIKESEMAPINPVKAYDNECGEKDDRVVETIDAIPAVTVVNREAIDRKARAHKARSATILSIDHHYEAEETLDAIPTSRIGQPFYFELDKTDRPRTYSIRQSLALPEPMYGILEPESSSGYDIGAHFCTPADTEEELYLQLSSAIQRDKIEVSTEKLGSGAFGHVWLGFWEKSPGISVQVAVKRLRDSHSNENKIKFLQEAAIMRQFTHKNVIYMYGTVMSSGPIMIVLEYMSRGNLKNYLRGLNSKYGEDIVLQNDTRIQFLRMARDIAAGMQYLHSLAFVHRDLAARNILLDSDMTCKIGDFGMSRDLVENDYYTSSGGRIPVKWTAPEAINFRKYSSSSDVWSYGIVLYEIWSQGHKPYLHLDNNEVIEAVSLGYRLPPPLHCPNMVYRLMIDCWHPDSQSRPRSYQIHHCLCSSPQSVFLHDSIGSRQRSQSELTPNTRSPTYMDLKYVYSVTE